MGPNLLHRLGSNPEAPFPPIQLALDEPNGLLAAGGDLSPERLLSAYRQGIFPWYSEGEPILWWSPAPRAVLFPNELQIPRSLKKRVRQHPFQITLNRDFPAVIRSCAAPRRNSTQEPGTWITEEMAEAYIRLHQMGFAHSIECWEGGELAGGLYGVSIGHLFCGESMFSRSSDASKIALLALVEKALEVGIGLIDIQMMTPHLQRMGAREISRTEYQRLLANLIPDPGRTVNWDTLPAIHV